MTWQYAIDATRTTRWKTESVHQFANVAVGCFLWDVQTIVASRLDIWPDSRDALQGTLYCINTEAWDNSSTISYLLYSSKEYSSLLPKSYVIERKYIAKNTGATTFKGGVQYPTKHILDNNRLFLCLCWWAGGIGVAPIKILMWQSLHKNTILHGCSCS